MSTDTEPTIAEPAALVRPRRAAGRSTARSATSASGPTATSSTSRSSGEFAHYLDDPYVAPIEREPLTDEVDVVVIGGGFGGLLAGARLREAGVDDIRIIEKGGDFGGTWYWNRYPGAMCDVESYIYLPLLEEIGYVPKEKYSHAPGDPRAQPAIGEHFDLYRNACFQTEVTELRWDDDDQPLDRHDQPRRRDARPVRVHGQRAAAPAEAAGHPRHRRRSRATRSTPAAGTTTTPAATPTGTSPASRTSGSASSAPAPRRCSACPTSARRPSSCTSSSARRRRSTCAPTAPPIRSGPPASSPAGRGSGWTTSTPSCPAASQDEDLVNDGWTDIIGKLLRDAPRRRRRRAHGREPRRHDGAGRLREDGADPRPRRRASSTTRRPPRR